MRRPLLFLSSGCMELSWLYAWANFLTASMLHRSFPFLEAITTFILAVTVTLCSKGKGWRVIYVLGLQIFGFILSSSIIVYTFNSLSPPFFSHIWLIEFFNSLKSPLEWLILILILFLTLSFWIRGLTFARRQMTHSKICSRFDLGLAAFFLLFLIKLIISEKGGIKIEDPVSQLLLFPYFIFSLSAIGLVRNQGSFQKKFLSGYQGLGVILIFTMAVLIFGTGLTIFFLPYLSLAAELGYGILKIAAKPLGYIFLAVIRFLYMPRAIRHENPSSPAKESIGDLNPPAEGSWFSDFLEKILILGLWGLIGLTLFAILGLATFYLLRWLFSRTYASQRRQGQWHLIPAWAERLRTFLLYCWRSIIRRFKYLNRAVEFYSALLGWGRHSGLPYFLSETPTEYGLRLKNRFPALQREIELIIDAFNREVYGEILLKEEQLATVRFAWRRLRSPLHWPSRLKNLFLHPFHLPEAIQQRTLDGSLIP